MRIGIRAHDMEEAPLDELIANIHKKGFHCTQLALSKAIHDFKVGIGTMTPGLAMYIRELCVENKVDIAVLGCYLNLCHPDPVKHAEIVEKYKAHIRFASILGCGVVGTETGAVNAAAVDVNAACTGFIVALDMAHKYLNFDEYKNILIVASERLSTHLDYEDRASCVLFGDGAGAVVVTKSDKKFCSFIGASGEAEGPNKTLYCKVNYDPNCPFIDDKKLYDGIITNDKQHKYLQMAGKGVYKFAVTAMPKAAQIVCDKVGTDVKDVDLVIPHQANIRIIETAVKTMGIDPEKVYTHLEHYGNTSSSCIPMCLDDLKRAGKLYDGMKICLVGFGAGLTYGAAYLEY